MVIWFWSISLCLWVIPAAVESTSPTTRATTTAANEYDHVHSFGIVTPALSCHKQTDSTNSKNKEDDEDREKAANFLVNCLKGGTTTTTAATATSLAETTAAVAASLTEVSIPTLTGAETTTASSTISSSSLTTYDGIPRSHSASNNRDRWTMYPPWNVSRNISESGFLKDCFWRIPGEWEKEIRLRTTHTLDRPCRIRQVPGDGNCLFHSISLCLCFAQNGTHWDMKTRLTDLYQHSQELRKQAVACLQDNQRRLVLQGHEVVKSRELVQAAASQYGLTCEEYCQEMLQESVWGGGPEIVALANCLKRPIHVYELVTTATTTTGRAGAEAKEFRLRRMACFGSPRFDVRGQEALHILSADSRFPDIMPGKQLQDGNHFLAVFPIYESEDGVRGRRQRKRLRGGSFWEMVIRAAREEQDEDENEFMTMTKKRDESYDLIQGPVEWMGGWFRRRLL